MALIENFGIVSLLLASALLIGVTLVSADVDESPPDLSIFKLRHVNGKKLAEQRAKEIIRDHVTASMVLHESLISDADYVKCPAYAHLFKLVDLQNQNKLKNDQAIKRHVIESLAVVVNSERDFYRFLMIKHLDQVSGSFLKTAQELESKKGSEERNTWFDLIECIERYVSPAVSEARMFLRDPHRSSAISRVRSFKAIPLSHNEAERQIPSKLVSKLAGKFDQLSQDGRFVSAEDFRKSVDLIESLDDANTAEWRSKYKSDPTIANEDLAKPKDESTKKVTNSKTKEPDVLDLIVPEEQIQIKEDDELTGEELSLSSDEIENKLFVLKFTQMRLEMRDPSRYEKAPPISMQLAFDFANTFNRLKSLTLAVQSTNDVGEVRSYINEPSTVKLARRVELAIKQYVDLTSLIDAMKLKQERGYETMDEFRVDMGQLKRKLETMDQSFDIDDLRRIHTLWTPKYVEYDTLDRLINGHFL